MPDKNPIYDFLKANNLTDKDEATFLREYSDSAKAKELYSFFETNKLTDKDFNGFYDTYLKKKEVGGAGLAAGAAYKPLTEQQKIKQSLGTVSVSSDKTAPQKEYQPEFDTDDPVKSALNPIRNKLAEYRQKPVSESTAQNPLLRQQKSKATTDLLFAQDYLEKQNFSTENEALGWLEPKLDKSKLVLKGDVTINKPVITLDDYTPESIAAATNPQNETDQLALRKYMQVRDVKEVLSQSPNLEKAAINLALKKEGLLSDQIEALGGNIPAAMRANILSQFLTNKNLFELASKDNELMQKVNTELYNLPQKYPTAAITVMADLISAEREKRGYNNAILNVTSEKTNDKIVDELTESGALPRQYKDMYDRPEVRFMVNAKLKTPGLVENVAEGLGQGILGIGKSAAEITGIRDLYKSDADKLYEGLQKQYESFRFKPKGAIHEITTTGGNIIGQFLPTAIGGNALLASKIVTNPMLANSIMIGLQSYGENKDQAEIDLAGKSKNEKESYALLNTAIEIASENILNDVRLAKQIATKYKPEIKNILSKFTAKEISAEAAEKGVKDIFANIAARSGQFVKGTLKVAEAEAREELAANIANNVVKQVFTGEDMSALEMASQAFDVYKTSFMGGLLLGGFGGINQVRRNPATQEIVYSIAQNPEYYKEIVQGQAQLDPEYAKDLKQKLSNIDYAAAVAKALDSRDDLSYKQKQKFLVTSLNEKMLQEKVANTPDKALTQNEEKQLKAIEIEKQSILDPERGLQKEVEEFYDADLLPPGSKMLLENEEGKFSPAKVGGYLRFIAQQSNNLDENWNPHEGKAPTMPGIPEQIIEIANERWKKEIDNAKSKEYAVQERSAEEIPLGETPGYSPEMVGRTPESGQTTEEGKTEGQEEAPIDQQRELDMGTEPISEPPSISVQMPGEVAKPQTTEIKPAEKNISKFPKPNKPIEELNSDELRQYAKKVKEFNSNIEKEFFGEEGAKRYKEAQIVSNSITASADEVKEADSVIKEMENSLTEEQKNEFFGLNYDENSLYDYEQIIQLSNKLSLIEQSENVQDLARSLKFPLLEFSKSGKPTIESKTLLKAAKKRADELGISTKNLVTKSIENIAKDLPDKTDAEFLVQTIIDKLLKESTQEVQKRLPVQEPQAQPQAGNPALRDVESKSDVDIENRMTEIQDKGNKATDEENREFDLLEKEMQKRERASVFNVPLSEAKGAIDALMKKEKEMPNGWGSFITKKDASESKSVIDDYSNAKEISDIQLKRDFKDAVMGNPDTWYADGLKLRESMKEAANRGIDIKNMIREVEKEFEKDGYTADDAKATVARKLLPIFEKSQKVETDTSKLIGEPSTETTEPQAESTQPKPGKTEVQDLGIGMESVDIGEGITISKDKTSDGFYNIYKDGKFVGLLGSTSFEQSKNKGQHFDENLMSNILDKLGIEHNKAVKTIQGENEFITIRTKGGSKSVKAVEDLLGKPTEVTTKFQEKAGEQAAAGGTKEVGAAKAIADKVRSLKVDLSKLSGGGAQSNVLGLPVAVWNAAIDTIALAIEGGATLAQAVQKAIKKHNLDKQKDFNQKEFLSKLEEATGEKLMEEPPVPPTEVAESGIYVERPATELSFRGLQDVANEFGYEDVKSRDRVSDVQERQNAINTANEWAQKGEYEKNIQKLLSEIADRERVPTAEQRLILEMYLANEKQKLRDIKDVNSEEFNTQLSKVKRIKEIATIARQEAGAALRIPDNGSLPHPITDYADAMTAMAEANSVDVLTEAQKKEVEQLVNNYEQRAKAAEEKVLAMEQRMMEIEAAKEVGALRQYKKAARKRNAEQLKEERERIVQSLKDKWRDAGKDVLSSDIPFRKQLAAIAPDVKKLVENLLESGVNELAQIVDKVHEIITDVLPEVSKQDITDIIGGKYNKKQKRSELAKQMADLKTEVQLIEKLEQLLKGEEPKTEAKKIERNQKIQQLRRQIKDIAGFEGELAKTADEVISQKQKQEKELAKKLDKAETEADKAEAKAEKEKAAKLEKERKEAEKERIRLEKQFEKELNQKEKERIKAEIAEAKRIEKELSYKLPGEKKLEEFKNRALQKEKEIREKIAKGDFEKEEKPTSVFDSKDLKQAFPREYQEMLDAIAAKEDAQRDYNIALYKAEQAKRGKVRKVIDWGRAIIATTKALKSGIDDSAVMMQNVVAMVSHPRSAFKALREHALDALSEKRFRRYLTELHNSPIWPLIEKSGLDITDPQSLKEQNKEEVFDKNLLNKDFKIGGKKFNVGKYLTRPFERAFTSLGNAMRVNMFSRITEKWAEEGKSFETHPEEYKALAVLLNTETGRGKLHTQIERASQLITAGIWSPRLMASRLNMLVVSDVLLPIFGGKGYYSGLSPKIRQMAIADMVKFIGAGISLMAFAAYRGADVDDDPESPTFGTIQIGDKKYNTWGGFTPYVKTFVQGATGKRNIRGERKDVTRSKIIFSFFRSRLTPAAGVTTNLLTGRDFANRPITAEGEIMNLMAPLSVMGIIDGLKKDGMVGLLNQGLPSFVGIGVSDERDFEEEGSKNKLYRPKIERPQRP